MHLQKFQDLAKLQSWIVNFQAGASAKRRISRSYCSGSRKSKQPTRWRTSSIQNQLMEKISLIMKNWIWWWLQHWNDAAMLLTWSTKLPSVDPWHKERCTILPPSGRLKNVFSGRQLGLVQEKKLVVFYTCMPRETVRQRGKKWRTQEDLVCSKHTLQYRKWRCRWTWKAWTV